MNDLGLKIKEEREILKLSQKELAIKVGVAQNTISEYESGLAKPSYEVLISMAKLFQVTTDYLLGLQDI